MTLADLPTLYDYTDPSTNLAAFPELEPYRFTFGEGLVPVVLAAFHGFREYGALGFVFGAFAGYMAPLPAFGYVAYNSFKHEVGLNGLGFTRESPVYTPLPGRKGRRRRCIRFARSKRTGKKFCVKWSS